MSLMFFCLYYYIFLTAKIAIISKTAKETAINNSRYDKIPVGSCY